MTESLLSPDHHLCPLVVSSGVWWSRLVSIGVNWCPLVLWWHKQRWRQAAHNAYCVTIVPQLIHLPEFVGRVFVRWRRPLCAEASRQIDRNGSSYHCCCPPQVEMESANAKYEIVQLMSESKSKNSNFVPLLSSRLALAMIYPSPATKLIGRRFARVIFFLQTQILYIRVLNMYTPNLTFWHWSRRFCKRRLSTLLCNIFLLSSWATN